MGRLESNKMASYFDEHNCEELANGQTPNHVLHFARLLIDSGLWNQVIPEMILLINFGPTHYIYKNEGEILQFSCPKYNTFIGRVCLAF